MRVVIHWIVSLVTASTVAVASVCGLCQALGSGPTLVYFSKTDSDFQIYIADMQTFKSQPIGRYPKLRGSNAPGLPVWSPDGTQIALDMIRNGNRDIYLVRKGDNVLRRLTDDLSTDEYPSWSPDGSKIAFISWRDVSKLHVLDLVDGSERKLVNIRVQGHTLAWSPDGQRIAFAAWQDDDIDIYTVELMTGKLVNLTQHAGDDIEPSWSPDGKRIAFTSARDGNYEVYAIDLMSGEVHNLSAHPYADRYPIWSPDGKQIAFQSWRTRNAEIYLVDAETGGLRQVSKIAGHDVYPMWMPGQFDLKLWQAMLDAAAED